MVLNIQKISIKDKYKMLELGYEIVHKNKRPVFFSGRLF